MGDSTVALSFKDRYEVVKRKITDRMKSSLLNDEPPGVRYKQGGDIPSIKVAKELSSRYTVASLLPYESFDEESQLYYNKDTVGFMLYASPATGLSPTDLKILNGLFSQVHKPETCIQVSLYADANTEPVLSEWQKARGSNVADPSNEAMFKLMAEKRVSYLKQGKWDSLFSDQPFLIRNFHLIISYTIPVPKGMDTVDLSKADVDFLMRKQEAIKGVLRSAKIHSKTLSPELFINLMNGLLNPSRSKQPVLHYDENRLINEQMVDSDTLVLFDSGASSIIHNDDAYSVLPFNVRQYPNSWPGYRNGELIGSFAENVLRINCPFLVTMTVSIPDQVSAKSKVKQKSARATQMVDSPVGKYATQWKDRKVDWDYTEKKIDSGNRMLKSFYQIILFAPQGKEQECEESLKSVYDSINWTVAKSRYTPVHSLLGALPMGCCQEVTSALNIFGHFQTMLSWNCTNIAPWIAEWRGNQTPMMLLAGRRGQLAYFDPFENDKGNYNISCCATSGSGKSFFTQEWIFSCLGSGGRVFIIDAGHSYKNICQLYKGTYLDFGEGSPILNPFTNFFSEEVLSRVEANPELSVTEYINDHMPMLKLLIGQMASPETPLDQKHQACLEKAILSAIKKYRQKTTITKVAQECLEQKDESGQVIEYAKDLSLMLHSYTKDGMFGRYFEGDNNIDLNNPLVVLELDALNSKGDLQATVLLILMMQINQVMYLSGNKKQRKLCIIDEAWRLLGKGRAGDFIEEGYRVARKHGGSFMTITQRISDYFESSTAQAAYMNSDFTIYLRQKEDELVYAEKMGYIQDQGGKVEVLKSLETIQGKYSELIINSPDGLAVNRFIVDPVTEKLYSTKSDEVSFIREAEAKGVHVLDAVEELIRRSGGR